MSAKSLNTALQISESPFTWEMPPIDIDPEQFLRVEIEKRENVDKEEPVAEFNWRGYRLDIVLAYEIYNTKKDVKAALKYAETCVNHLKEIVRRNCQDKFLLDSKKTLLHIALATKAHLLLADQRIKEVESIIDELLPIKDKAAIHGIKAAIYIEYGSEGHRKALESAKKASEMDPSNTKWIFLVGEAMGRLRRNEHAEITQEEVSAIEKAYRLEPENPSYIVHKAQIYSEMASQLFYSTDRFSLKKNKKMSEDYAEKAVAAFQKAVELRPNCTSIKARAAHGLLRIKPKDLVDMRYVKGLLDDVLEKAPNNCLVHHDLGYYYDKFENNVEKSIEFLEKAHEQDNYKAFIYLITIKWKCRLKNQIMADLEKALKKYQVVEVQEQLLAHMVVFTLLIKEDWKTTLVHLNRSLQINPSARYLVNYLSFIGGRVNVIQMIRDKLRSMSTSTIDFWEEYDVFMQLSSSVDLYTCQPKNFVYWKRDQMKANYFRY